MFFSTLLPAYHNMRENRRSDLTRTIGVGISSVRSFTPGRPVALTTHKAFVYSELESRCASQIPALQTFK